jgi:hypothetical protein
MCIGVWGVWDKILVMGADWGEVQGDEVFG